MRFLEKMTPASKKLTESFSTDSVLATGLEVHNDGTRNVTTACGLVDLDDDALKLEV